MKLTTTLNRLKARNRFKARNVFELFEVEDMETLLNHVGQNYDHNKPINLLTILESSGVDNFFCSFCALEQDWEKALPILINILSDISESVLPIFEEIYPDNDSPRKAIEAARTEKNEKKLKMHELCANYAAASESNLAAEAAADSSARAAEVAAYSSAHAAEAAAYAALRASRAAERSEWYATQEAPEDELTYAAIQSRWYAIKKTEYPAKHKKQIEIIKKYLTWD